MTASASSVVIVDASVSLKWALNDEENTQEALALCDHGASGRIHMLAPSLWFYEVVNGLVTAVRRGRISSDQGSDALDHLAEVGVGLTDPNAEDCYRTAVDYQIAAYDAAYVSLAGTLGAVLWTGDHKLWEAVRSKVGFIKWIGDYPA